MTASAPGANWHVPKQARSRARFAHILDAAADLFARQGIEGVTTNHIAAHAGVSIGSLYQFFPGKEALLAALLDRYLTGLAGIFPVERQADLTFEQVVARMASEMVAFDATHPAFGRIFTASDTPSYAPMMQLMQERIISAIATMLAAYQPTMTDTQRVRCASVGYFLVRGLMGAEGIPRDDLVIEVSTALIGYVVAFCTREGIAFSR